MYRSVGVIQDRLQARDDAKFLWILKSLEVIDYIP